jgi:hypothetical protein
MELCSNSISGMFELNVTGNSRIKILNDYEDGLINKKNISYSGSNLKLKAYNDKDIVIDTKSYLQLSYIDKTPYINSAWNYNEFTPSHIVYPIRDITQETMDEFEIRCPFAIDKYEMEKNENIMDREYYNLNVNKTHFLKKIIKCPRIISKHGILERLNDSKWRPCEYQNSHESDSESDEVESHNENQVSTNASVFDEPQ